MTTDVDKQNNPAHIPVLLDQVLKYLAPNESKLYVDATFGNGGYAAKILDSSENVRLIAIDQDPNVAEVVNTFEQKYSGRFHFVHGNFADLANILKPFGKIDGIVWDLGVSSMQLDNPERGFSFSKDAALDMRMSSAGLSAADFVNSASMQELADVIFYNAGESKARQIARRIVEKRQESQILTTKQLADIVRSVVHQRSFSIDPATKTFQAIRIFVNNELEAFKSSLNNLESLLNVDAKVACVSFHSLEDVIIKDYFKNNSAKKVARSKYHQSQELTGVYEILTPKPITPSDQEVRLNPRSRSAKLRAARKI
jgi:16S rRNA (cytosine1402-N4)-methyltransferase